jgi:hypothetical protein
MAVAVVVGGGTGAAGAGGWGAGNTSCSGFVLFAGRLRIIIARVYMYIYLFIYSYVFRIGLFLWFCLLQKVKNGFMENPAGSAEVVPSPKGTVLLISPWNYPVGLALKPLVAILAAGNCCVIKPSEVSANCAVTIKKFVDKYLDPAAVRVILGGVVIIIRRFIVFFANNSVLRFRCFCF